VKRETSNVIRLADLQSAICYLPIFAHSISHRAAAILRPGVTGRVLASFRSVCDLVTDRGDVVALVWGGLGNGPLNVVLDRELGTALPAGAQFAVADHSLTVGGVEIDLSRAARWEARPDWAALRSRRREIGAAAQAARRSMAELSEQRLLKQAGPAVCVAAAAFQQVWRRDDRTTLQFAICNLCGLGPGLTPAGDDWLAGWLLGLHLTGDLRSLADLEGLIAEIAPTRTTTLSRAFLAVAAAGEADESWHDLLDALAGELANQRIVSASLASQDRVSLAFHAILQHGATSGAAMLAGFFAGIEALAVCPDPCRLIPALWAS
jgi:hypothetical protein